MRRRHVDGPGLGIHIGHAVRTTRVARRAQQAFATGACVSSGIADNPSTHGEQMPLSIGANRALQSHWMALDMMLGGLFARQNGFHRTAQQVRGQGGLRLDRQLFFCAKRPAAGPAADAGKRPCDLCVVQ